MSETSGASIEIVDELPTPAGPRRARLRVNRVDPWSVMKTSFVLSLGLGIVIIVAMILLWLVLSSLGVFDAINRTISDVAGQSSGLDITVLASFSNVAGYALLLAAFEVVMTSALATLIAAIYNVTTGITGGVEVTLSEE